MYGESERGVFAYSFQWRKLVGEIRLSLSMAKSLIQAGSFIRRSQYLQGTFRLSKPMANLVQWSFPAIPVGECYSPMENNGESWYGDFRLSLSMAKRSNHCVRSIDPRFAYQTQWRILWDEF
jgi:hypothetical protein